MSKEKAYLVMEDCLIEVATKHECSPCSHVGSDLPCPKDKIKLVRFLWKDTSVDVAMGPVAGPRMGSYLQGPGVFIDNPSKGGLTRSLDIALQKLQLLFDRNAKAATKTAEECLKKLEKYSSMNARELVLGKEAYTSPFTGVTNNGLN